MKKILSIVLLLIIMLLTCACGASKDAANAEACDVAMENMVDGKSYSVERSGGNGDMQTDTVSAEMICVVEEPLVYVSFTQHSVQAVDDAGVKLFICQYSEPEIITEDEAVNGWIGSVVDAAARDTARDAEWVQQQARIAYEGREEDGPSFYAYSYYSDLTTERLDSKVISALQVNSVYSGGAHPNYAQIAYNLDLARRTELTLTDVILPGAADYLRQGVLDSLAEQFGGLEHSGLYADYPEIVESSFRDPGLTSNWYFGTAGLVIYFNCYDIAPYAAGIIKVEFSYDTLDGILQPEYFPNFVSTGEGSGVVLNQPDGRRVLNVLPGGECFYFGTEGILSDVKVFRLNGWITEDVPIEGPLVFAANYLSAQDAIALEDGGSSYLLICRNGEATQQKMVISSNEMREIVAKQQN